MHALYHVGFTVSIMERSLAFYLGAAGMELQRQSGFSRKEFGVLTNNPGSTFKVAFLTSSAFTLQLIEYLTGGDRRPPLELHHNRIGSPHISFYVDDVDAKFAEIEALGNVTVTSGVAEVAPNVRSFYTEDPDGVPVEFLQMER